MYCTVLINVGIEKSKRPRSTKEMGGSTFAERGSEKKKFFLKKGRRTKKCKYMYSYVCSRVIT